MYQTGLSIYALPEYEVVADEGYHGDHAAKWETSLTQYLFPDLVDMNEAEPPDKSMDGVGGEDPRIHASKELGEKTAELIIERLGLVANRLARNTSARERSKFISASDVHCEMIHQYSWGCLGNENYWRLLAWSDSALERQLRRSYWCVL
jgi:hypothetical protein